jgi:subtilisin
MVVGEAEDLLGLPSNGLKGEHGTHVAGIIGARGNPADGPVGVADECQIRSYRVFPRADATLGADNYSIITAVRAAVDEGCQLINLSVGGSDAREDGVRDAVNFAWDNGVLCIAAAGNDHRRPVVFPAAHPNCIAVGAIGKLGTFDPAFDGDIADPKSGTDDRIFVASFSNVGRMLDFVAPGVGICSTLPGNAMGSQSGTSMAAPCVTALAAVLVSRNRNVLNMASTAERSEAVMQMLTSRASVLGFGSPDYEGFGLIRI